MTDARILTECYAGFADLASGVPVTERTTFNTFSITKTATAAAVLKLVEQNRTGLDEFVHPMFREFHFKYPFTLRQLLSHEAGFPDPIPISWIHLQKKMPRSMKKFITSTIDKHSGQKFKPGTKFSYSSVGHRCSRKSSRKSPANPLKIISSNMSFARPDGNALVSRSTIRHSMRSVTDRFSSN
ncbi:MAG: beta-lactamase family protein [Lewinellaceae bacterium]|nr:beta-lactamase family protein [Lewinellaceae bacterium]